jgi:hypothetical protein
MPRESHFKLSSDDEIKQRVEMQLQKERQEAKKKGTEPSEINAVHWPLSAIGRETQQSAYQTVGSTLRRTR